MALTNRHPRYIHGVRADDDHWTDAWNFSLGGTRGSIGLINAAESHTAPYDVDLAVLAGPPKYWPPIFLSVFLAGEAGHPRRVKMVEDPGVVR